jgi:hypothetical protein
MDTEAQLRAAGFSEEEIQAHLAQQGPTPAAAAALQYGPAVGAGVSGASALGGAAALTRRLLPSGFSNARLNSAVQQSGGVGQLLRELQGYDASGRGSAVTLGDLSRPLGEQGADFVATNNEAARSRLLNIHAERQRGVPQRLLRDVNQLAPGPVTDPVAKAAEVKKAQQEWAAGPEGYEGLRANNPQIDPRFNRSLLEFSQSPKLKAMWQKAHEVGITGPMPNAAPTSFETLHDLKQQLDDAVSAGFANGHGTLARRLAEARNQLDATLEAAVSGYKDVNAKYRAFTREQELLLSGRDAWRSSDMHVSTLKDEVANMSPEELKIFRQGILGGYAGDIETAKTNRNFANEMLSRDLQTSAKLEVVFGNQKAFEQAVTRFAQEGAMSRMGGYVGGSATARRLASGASDAAAEAVVEHAASPSLTGIVNRFLPKIHQAKQAKILEPYFTTQGSEAIRELLRNLPK